MPLTVKERLAAIEKAGWPLAWDGCHKIYMLQEEQAETEARDMGYTVFAASELPEIWDSSCSLRFVNRWALAEESIEGFRHELNIEQFEDYDDNSDTDLNERNSA